MNFPLSAALLLACAATLRGQGTPGSPPAPAPVPPSSSPPSAAKAGAASSGGTAPDPAKAIRRLEGSRYELNGILFDRKTRAITLPAKVNMTDGLLEYALVHESGKVHESLLSTAVSPFDLNVVLLLLDYEPGTGFFDLSDKAAGAVPVKNPKLPAAAGIRVTLGWKTPAGAPATARLETLLLNLDTKSTVTDGPFTYTGSMVMEDGTFLARETGSILALYVDPAALINNPREGNGNDDIWIPDKTKVPEKETAVTVTLTPVPKSAAKPAPKEKSPSRSAPKPSVKK